MKWRVFTTIPALFRLAYRWRLWLLVPTFLLLLIASVLMFLAETPILVPFYYAIF